MGWLIVGIIGAIICVAIYTVLAIKFDWDFNEGVFYICLLLPCVVALLISTCGNDTNYNEKTVVSTQPLIALSDGLSYSGSGLFYISISADNTFTYYAEVETEYTTENSNSYISKSVPGSMSVVVEEKNNTQPRLLVYKQTGKKSFWYFNVPPTITEYVFYVPVGTIQRNIILN